MKNLLFTAIAIFGLSTITFGQTVPSYVPSNGLVGWWPFNGNAYDESGNGNNGTINGATLTSNRFGNANSAFSFDGLTSYITGSIANFTNTSSSTVSAWVKYTGDAGGQPYDLYFQYGSYGSHTFSYDYNFNNKNLDLYSQCFANPYTSLNITNAWHHIVVADSLAETTIFIDGNILVNFTSGSGSNCYQGSNQFYIGGGVNNQFTTGLLDDIGIWNRALTRQEITSLYSSSSVGVNEVSQCNLFSVFPNPAQSAINVKADAKLVGSVFTIYDYTGKGVKTGKLNSENTTIEMGNLSGGIYTFSIDENRKQTFKVIKK